jgi:hypothetical protein
MSILPVFFWVIEWKSNRPKRCTFKATTSHIFQQVFTKRDETQRECWRAEIGQDTKGIFNETAVPYIHTEIAVGGRHPGRQKNPSLERARVS